MYVCMYVSFNFIKYVIKLVCVDTELTKIICLNMKPLNDLKGSGCIHDTLFELHL
jgi:hypothetical protein